MYVFVQCALNTKEKTTIKMVALLLLSSNTLPDVIVSNNMYLCHHVKSSLESKTCDLVDNITMSASAKGSDPMAAIIVILQACK